MKHIRIMIISTLITTLAPLKTTTGIRNTAKTLWTLADGTTKKERAQSVFVGFMQKKIIDTIDAKAPERINNDLYKFVNNAFDKTLFTTAEDKKDSLLQDHLITGVHTAITGTLINNIFTTKAKENDTYKAWANFETKKLLWGKAALNTLYNFSMNQKEFTAKKKIAGLTNLFFNTPLDIDTKEDNKKNLAFISFQCFKEPVKDLLSLGFETVLQKILKKITHPFASSLAVSLIAKGLYSGCLNYLFRKDGIVENKVKQATKKQDADEQGHKKEIKHD